MAERWIRAQLYSVGMLDRLTFKSWLKCSFELKRNKWLVKKVSGFHRPGEGTQGPESRYVDDLLSIRWHIVLLWIGKGNSQWDLSLYITHFYLDSCCYSRLDQRMKVPSEENCFCLSYLTFCRVEKLPNSTRYLGHIQREPFHLERLVKAALRTSVIASCNCDTGHLKVLFLSLRR